MGNLILIVAVLLLAEAYGGTGLLRTGGGIKKNKLFRYKALVIAFFHEISAVCPKEVTSRRLQHQTPFSSSTSLCYLTAFMDCRVGIDRRHEPPEASGCRASNKASFKTMKQVNKLKPINKA